MFSTPTIEEQIAELLFKNPDKQDPYIWIASKMNGIPYDDITKEQRTAAKQLFWPFVWGQPGIYGRLKNLKEKNQSPTPKQEQKS